MRRIVITGATGMIGAALAKCAVDKGIEVLCIVRSESKRIINLPKSDLVRTEFCEISEYDKFAFNGRYDLFFHLAWDKTFGASRDDVNVQVANIQHTLDAIRLAQRLGCRKFIGTGSQAEYGAATVPLGAETPANPTSGYGVAKYAAGKLGSLLCSQLSMDFNWVRILSVFGPLDGAQTLIMYTINELKAGRSPELTRCEQVWDYLYCDDSAKALLCIGENGVSGKTYTLGSGCPQRLSIFLELIRDIVAPDIELRFGEKAYYPHQPMYLSADITELAHDTGWKPEVSFEVGVRSILSAMK